MSDHSPEPWEVGEEHKTMAQFRANGIHIGTFRSARLLGANGVSPGVEAARIVACVNACRGISTKALEHTHLLELFSRLEYANEDTERQTVRCPICDHLPGKPGHYSDCALGNFLTPKHAEDRLIEIVLWDWANASVLLSNAQSRPMTAGERINPHITDAKTGEEIFYVISYNTRNQDLIRYATENGVVSRIGERREVRIETDARQKGGSAENHT